MVELVDASLAREGQIINKIILSQTADVASKWITLGAGAGINKDGMTDPFTELD